MRDKIKRSLDFTPMPQLTVEKKMVRLTGTAFTFYLCLGLSKTSDTLTAGRLHMEDIIGAMPHCTLQARLLVVESSGDDGDE